MDYLDTLLGAAIAAGAFLLGRARPRKQEYKDPEPICGCKHHFSFHDDVGCHKTRRDSGTGFNVMECDCKKYSGPVPIDSYTAES